MGFHRGAGFAILLLAAAILLAGCVSLGDSKGFEYMTEYMKSGASLGPLRNPVETMSVTMRIGENGTVSYSQQRRANTLDHALSYNYLDIVPIYICRNMVNNIPEIAPSFLCPDNFVSFEDEFRREVAGALLKKGFYADQEMSLQTLPFPYLLVDGRTGTLVSISSQRKPSYPEMMRAAERPRTLLNLTAYERNFTMIADFGALPPAGPSCVRVGLPYLRHVTYRISSYLPFLNYSVSGPAASSVSVEKGTSAGYFFLDYPGTEVKDFNNKAEPRVTDLSVCFGGSGK